MALPTFTLEADFDFDGTYETDLSSYADHRTAITVDRGLDSSGVPKVGQMRATLKNETGIFTPWNSSSSLYGLLVPEVPIRLKALWSAVTYVLFTGYIVDWVPSFGAMPEANNCAILAKDIWMYFVDGPPINVLTSTARDTDGALDAICDAMGLAAGDRSLVDGVQDLPYHFALNQQPSDAVMDAVKSEMGGHVFVNAASQLVFQARNTRLGVTSPRTWGDGTNVLSAEVNPSLRMQDVVTSVTVLPTIFYPGQADTEVMRFTRGKDTPGGADSLFVAANTIYEATFELDSPITALTTLEANTDYEANSAIDGTGTDRTSSLNPTITNLGAAVQVKFAPTVDCYVTFFRIRGTPAAFSGQTPRFNRTKQPSGTKAPIGIEVRVPFADDATATQRYPEHLLRINRRPYPVLTLPFNWTHDDIVTQMLDTELGELVKFADTAAGLGTDWVTQLDDWWYTEALRHEIRPGNVHRSTVQLVPSSLFRNLDAIAFDTFNRANASGDLGVSSSGHTWTNDTGFDIASNAARANSDVQQEATISLGTGINDQVVEVDLASISTGDEVGVLLRYASGNDYYRAYLDQGSNQVILEKKVGGVVSSVSSPSFTVGAAHALTAMIQGTRIRVYVDGILRIDTTDSGVASGSSAGLFARNANATATFEDWYAEGL